MQEELYTLEGFIDGYCGRYLHGSRFKGGDQGELGRWQEASRGRLLEALGTSRLRDYASELGLPEVPAAREVGLTRCDGYTMRRLLLETLPGVTMPVCMLVPDGLDMGKKHAAVIAAHGHASGGKEAVAGAGDGGEISLAIDKYAYDYGRAFAKAGYVVFCPDAAGAGQRRERPQWGEGKRMESSCGALARKLLPLGLSVAGLWLYENMRLVSYAASLPFIDSRAIMCAGFSGGGMQALDLTAADGRIVAAIVSGYFYGVKEALIDMPENCDCNYAPGLWLDFDMGDIASLAAPRPLRIESGREDPLAGASGLANVTRQVDVARRAYAAAGAQGNLSHAVGSGGHRWYGEGALEFLDGVRKGILTK